MESFASGFRGRPFFSSHGRSKTVHGVVHDPRHVHTFRAKEGTTLLGLEAVVVTLRATQKVLRNFSEKPESARPPDTGLGDWYVNRLVVDRRPLLILVSSLSLLAILKPARNVKALPSLLPDLVAGRLHRLGVDPYLINQEVEAMDPVEVGKTADRSVVGIMVDFAKMIPHFLPIGGWDQSWLPMVEEKLQENPCHASRPFEEVIFPETRTVDLLVARWQSV